jgi:hypothetical protein
MAKAISSQAVDAKVVDGMALPLDCLARNVASLSEMMLATVARLRMKGMARMMRWYVGSVMRFAPL